MDERKKRKDEIIPINVQKDSLYKLLILENFHNSKKLIKIADFIYDDAYLNSHEYLLLAGFYHRLNNIEKFKKIINTKLSDQFDKRYIIDKLFIMIICFTRFQHCMSFYHLNYMK